MLLGKHKKYYRDHSGFESPSYDITLTLLTFYQLLIDCLVEEGILYLHLMSDIVLQLCIPYTRDEVTFS